MSNQKKHLKSKGSKQSNTYHIPRSSNQCGSLTSNTFHQAFNVKQFFLFKLVNLLSTSSPGWAICAGPRRLSGLRFLNGWFLFFRPWPWHGWVFVTSKFCKSMENLRRISFLQDDFFPTKLQSQVVCFLLCFPHRSLLNGQSSFRCDFRCSDI